MAAQTLFDKIWESHVVRAEPDGTTLLYIDRQLVHEVTSPQAFEGLKLSGRRPRRPGATLAVPDHNVPTTDRTLGIADPLSAIQIQTLEENCRDFGITLFGMNDIRQGVVHVIGPEQGFTLPGTTIVCGDSHTSTHGAFGALAFGIGTSEVEHVLATQCLVQKRPKTMEIRVDGALPTLCSAKDMILAIIGKIGTAGGTGYVIEYTGSAIRALSMEGRMTLCNMSIEAGARAGMVAPDEKTIAYIKGRPLGAKGRAVRAGRATPGSSSKPMRTPPMMRPSRCEAEDIAPQVSWGTSPGMVIGVDQKVPDPRTMADENTRKATERALAYMGLTAEHADHRDHDRQGFHRLLHEFTDRRSSPGRKLGKGQTCREDRPRDGGAWFRSRQTTGRTGRARPVCSTKQDSNGGKPAAACVWR